MVSGVLASSQTSGSPRHCGHVHLPPESEQETASLAPGAAGRPLVLPLSYARRLLHGSWQVNLSPCQWGLPPPLLRLPGFPFSFTCPLGLMGFKSDLLAPLRPL